MLIIYSHPNKIGHCGYILQKVREELDRRAQRYQILDLYEMKYDPILKQEELYSAGQKQVSPENFKIQELIKNEDKFIFIYPTWWSSMPAILKGFIDRVMVSGFAFKYVNGMPVGLLKGKAAIFTSTGSPNFVNLIVRPTKYFSNNVLRFCGIKSKGFIVGNALRFEEGKKIIIEKTVRKGISYLI